MSEELLEKIREALGLYESAQASIRLSLLYGRNPPVKTRHMWKKTLEYIEKKKVIEDTRGRRWMLSMIYNLEGSARRRLRAVFNRLDG